jgi:hypothetical protein
MKCWFVSVRKKDFRKHFSAESRKKPKYRRILFKLYVSLFILLLNSPTGNMYSKMFRTGTSTLSSVPAVAGSGGGGGGGGCGFLLPHRSMSEECMYLYSICTYRQLSTQGSMRAA